MTGVQTCALPIWDKVKPTKEEQKKINSKIAERKLRLLLNENYQDGDLHIDFGYVRKKGMEYRTREEMRKDADIFLREMRKVYKAAGYPLKYVHVMEVGEKGAAYRTRILRIGDRGRHPDPDL